jgi:hypothetical protein
MTKLQKGDVKPLKRVFTVHNLLTCSLLLPLIAAAETLLYLIKLPAWPVMLCMVSYFLAEKKREKAGHIILGGLLGELSCLILNLVFMPLVWLPLLGEKAHFAGLVLYVLVFVGLIVLLDNTWPRVFNSFAFLFFLAAALGYKSDALPALFSRTPLPFVWMAETLFGGTAVVLGCIGIGKIVRMTGN